MKLSDIASGSRISLTGKVRGTLIDNTSDPEQSRVMVELMAEPVEKLVYNWAIEYVLVDNLWEEVEL